MTLGPRIFEDADYVSYFSQYTPIGCRDTDTLIRCCTNGLSAHFTGSPTVFCKPFPEIQEVEGTVLFVYVDPRVFESGGVHYRKQTSLPDSVVWMTNVVPFSLTEVERRRQCKIRHEAMTRAETVVTNRIHVALPALGMRKALTFVEENVTNPGRLSALLEDIGRWKAKDCSGGKFNPEEHRYDYSAYKQRVIQSIQEQCGKVLRCHL